MRGNLTSSFSRAPVKVSGFWPAVTRTAWELIFLLFDREEGRPGPLAAVVFTVLVVGGCLLTGAALLGVRP